MGTTLAFLGFGTVFLLAGSDLLIRGSKFLGYKFRVSQLFISMTVVALGTSLPELTISGISAVQNDIGLATGNIVGSCILNGTLILGLAMTANPLRIGTNKTQKNTVILMYITVLFIILYMSSFSTTTIAGVLLGMALISFLFQYVWALTGRTQEDRKAIAHYPKVLPHMRTIVLYVILGLVGMMLGGMLIVRSVNALSSIFNLSTTFLGLTLTATLTSLPELITTVLAQFGKDGGKLALGNILGSNIYNLALVGGIISFRPIAGKVRFEEFIFLAATSIIIWYISRRYSGKMVPRIWGIGLILLFVVYVYTTSFGYLLINRLPPLPGL